MDTKPRVVIAGLGDAGMLVATRLARSCDVVGISTRPALVSGQELGMRLSNPARWRVSSLVPYDRVRKLDPIRRIHGKITHADLAAKTVTVECTDGSTLTEPYDILIVATGASNGFWRHDRVETLAEIDAGLDAVTTPLAAAKKVAVVGGGATGVSVADNLARKGGSEIHLFHSGDLPLPGYHPDARSWVARTLQADGVIVHPGHRAVMPDGFDGERLTTDPVEWSTGQEPFAADITLWATGRIKPHSAFLPTDVLDDDGFVKVDEYLRVPGHPEVFAVGDVAASDPHHSSARNWGWQVVARNVRVQITGKGKRRRYKAPEYRWGSILGMQDRGLVVVQPNGKRFRVPDKLAEPLLVRFYVLRYLYGGLRPERR